MLGVEAYSYYFGSFYESFTISFLGAMFLSHFVFDMRAIFIDFS